MTGPVALYGTALLCVTLDRKSCVLALAGWVGDGWVFLVPKSNEISHTYGRTGGRAGAAVELLASSRLVPRQYVTVLHNVVVNNREKKGETEGGLFSFRSFPPLFSPGHLIFGSSSSSSSSFSSSSSSYWKLLFSSASQFNRRRSSTSTK